MRLSLQNMQIRRAKFVLVTCITVLNFSLGTCRAQEQPIGPNSIYEAQRFLQLTYPEASGKGLNVIFSVGGTYDAQWVFLPRLEIALLETNYTPSIQMFMGKEGQRAPLWQSELIAYFDFDKVSRIEGVVIAGDTFSNDTRNNDVARIIRASRNSTLDQVAKILKQAGAKFGPEDKEAFLASVPLRGLQPFLGSLTLKSAEFQRHAEQVDGTVIELRWFVKVEAKTLDAQTYDYTLVFEPFAGKLVSLHRIVPPRKY